MGRASFADRLFLTRPATVLQILLATTPFLVIPVLHLASAPETATGFFHEEMPYYAANGRAAFERGNGWAYSNPYDPDPAAPAIYFHWLLWLIGSAITRWNCDPGQLNLVLTLLSAPVFSAMTWRLVSYRTTEHRWRSLNFLLAMTGGGLLVIGAFAARMTGSQPASASLLEFDPGQGLWFLNWGRNSLFPTEAIYHCLVVACWLSELRDKPYRATLFCLLLATTHPWSGLELLLTMNAWRVWNLLKQPGRSTIRLFAVSATMLALFLAYYKWWLPGFEHHAQLQKVWELDWSLSTRSAILAYSLVCIPAVIRSMQSQTFSRTEQFLAIALLVATGLVFHDRFIRPVQPLHFTRGYIWLPLFLLGLPVLEKAWNWLADRKIRQIGIAAIILLMSVDNLIFSYLHAGFQFRQERGYHLTAGDRAILRHLHQYHAKSVVLSESETLNYLMPAYAGVRPWMGHPFNTPGFQTRKQVLRGLLDRGAHSFPVIPDDVDVFLTQRGTDRRTPSLTAEWTEMDSGNGEWQVWVRIRQLKTDPETTEAGNGRQSVSLQEPAQTVSGK
ncbi:MAG: hypothetical protein JNL58_09165 [Planctomyces sp.]|nr:hypothetical protein [Planctomyces sp.]